ncbi:MAG: hypothetical protein H5T76_38810, partial [Streptomyces sp.]|nr:hypothetical protein [Streptomyces sp.]
RMVLVPASMALLGRAAWWLPRPLRRRLPRVHLDRPTPAEAPVAPRAEDLAQRRT